MSEPDRVAIIEKETGQRCGNRALTAADLLRENAVTARAHEWTGLADMLEALADELDREGET